jgi:HPt (histidine-containing phosphotransfer) domain-containing protein
MPVKETPLHSVVFDQLRAAMAADPAGLAALYRDYLADAWHSFHTLRESVLQRQFTKVQERAHYLKGSSLVLGAHSVARYSTRLEDAAIANNFSELGGVLDDIQNALREVQLELVDRLGPSVLPAGETAA